jgi:hypothetical protein
MQLLTAYKTIKGVRFTFNLEFISNERKAIVRIGFWEAGVICDISEDFNYVLVPSGQIIVEGVEVKKIKLNRINKPIAKDYNDLNLIKS